MSDSDGSHLKDLMFVGSSRKDLKKFPAGVKANIGAALYEAQMGRKPAAAKPLQGFGSAGVLEVIEDERGNTFRAVYTVRFVTAVYVLHAFMKKSKKGTGTPKEDVDLIRARLKDAEQIHKQVAGVVEHGNRTRAKHG
ncbi:MAG: type II toxin-antitoxin system RelE/ParE family toxin [Alphaproteobacteria bacterium]|nr:type II toxin-antitoxin system RelE/ParE family toxin [Alphaproteobacteria bacterium]